jgi:hypothetical protein
MQVVRSHNDDAYLRAVASSPEGDDLSGARPGPGQAEERQRSVMSEATREVLKDHHLSKPLALSCGRAELARPLTRHERGKPLFRLTEEAQHHDSAKMVQETRAQRHCRHLRAVVQERVPKAVGEDAVRGGLIADDHTWLGQVPIWPGP